MNVPRYAALAAQLLGRHLPQAQPVSGDRERGIATIERAMLARARRRRVMWLSGTLAAAATVILAVQAGRLLSAPPAGNDRLVAIAASPAGRGAALHARDGQRPLEDRAAMGAGQSIETPSDGGASLRLSTGTSMDLAGNTSFRVDSQGAIERFSLQRGELTAHVAKLGAGQRFIVTTPDAEVEVRGTRFRVDVLEAGEACGNGSRTRLEVTEGIVEVRQAGTAVSIRAGQSWPADCAEKPGKAAGVQSPPPTESTRGAAFAPGPSASDRASSLAPQNDLFAEGVAKRRQGDVSGALRAYQEFIRRFPRSPLAENAAAERMRLLAMNHDPRARDEARGYLSRYPRGFAAKEARELAAIP